MIIGLVIIFGAVVGLISYYTYGSGHGIKWDISLGILGFTIANSLATYSYLVNHFGPEDIIGFNWYCICIGTLGSLVSIYIGRLLHPEHTLAKIGFNIIIIK